MIYLSSIFVALLSGLIIGILNKKVFDFSKIKLNNIWIMLIGLILQSIAGLLKIMPQVVLCLIVLLVFVGVWFNKKHFGLWVIFVGLLFNSTVMFLNQGTMPVSLEVLQRPEMKLAYEALKNGMDYRHSILTEISKLPWLADIYYIEGFLGFGMRICSIGDFIVALGAFVFVLELILHGFSLDLRFKKFLGGIKK